MVQVAKTEDPDTNFYQLFGWQCVRRLGLRSLPDKASTKQLQRKDLLCVLVASSHGLGVLTG